VQRAADWVAAFSGSIGFLVLHVLWFTVWIGWNVLLPSFDPYPFGLLTMAVSLEAIVLSVLVLLSQNRQAAKDHIHSDIEYEVNLKAELEVAHLHDKVDRLSEGIAGRLARIEKLLTRARAPSE
jgi:CRP/FNR family transcriptional regulator, cyclic AMP receptor protein